MRELGVRADERQYAFRGAAFPRLMPEMERVFYRIIAANVTHITVGWS
jgi:hypothetical protein